MKKQAGITSILLVFMLLFLVVLSISTIALKEGKKEDEKWSEAFTTNDTRIIPVLVKTELESITGKCVDLNKGLTSTGGSLAGVGFVTNGIPGALKGSMVSLPNTYSTFNKIDGNFICGFNIDVKYEDKWYRINHTFNYEKVKHFDGKIYLKRHKKDKSIIVKDYGWQWWKTNEI